MSYQPPDPTYLSLALKYYDVTNFVKNSTQRQTLKNIDQTWQTPRNIRQCSPVSMNMACTVGVAEVDQGRVDQNVLLALFQQVLKDFYYLYISLILRSRFLLLFFFHFCLSLFCRYDFSPRGSTGVRSSRVLRTFQKKCRSKVMREEIKKSRNQEIKKSRNQEIKKSGNQEIKKSRN